MAYLASDDDAKEQLRTEETQKRLSLKGYRSDSQRLTLIYRIVETIAHETPVEKVPREVNLLKEIHQCKRGGSEQTEAYANRFEEKAAQ